MNAIDNQLPTNLKVSAHYKYTQPRVLQAINRKRRAAGLSPLSPKRDA